LSLASQFLVIVGIRLNIRITHLDGKLPNLALMRLSAWHKAQNHSVFFSKCATKDLFEPDYDIVYGSTIFHFSRKKVDVFKKNFPDAIIGGTGERINSNLSEVGVPDFFNELDYNIYPEFTNSIGFTQRGCRLKCKFCVVPEKEGKNYSVDSVHQIYRGKPYPKNLVLLDNDFFGNELWQQRAKEIIDGGFKVNFNQGINVRLIHEEGARELAKMKYYDVSFTKKRIYTAWDNLKDEKIFFKGVQILNDAGIPSNHIMAYMLIGYRIEETVKEILYRIEKMKDRNILPYPMIYTKPNEKPKKHLKEIQRWVIRKYYQFIPFSDYAVNSYPKDKNSLEMEFNA